MSHSFRFIGTAMDEQHWVICDDELHHLHKVLRLQLGENVEVTDGKGAWVRGELVGLETKKATVRVLESFRESEATAKCIVAIGALKPGSVDDILPALVELGVHEIHLFQQPQMAKSRLAESAQKRWRKIITGAVKQSKRSWMASMTIHPSVDAFIGSLEGASCRWILDPEGETSLFVATQTAEDSRVAVIGGEAGLHENEIKSLLGAGFVKVSCGAHVLRAMTAAVAAAAIMTAEKS